MKWVIKIILVCLVVAVCAGLGFYEFSRSHSQAVDSDDEGAQVENVPSVVTVQTGALKQVTLHHYVQGYGTIQPQPATTGHPAASAQLAAPSADVVAAVPVVEGQHVDQGDVLVELNSATTTAAFAKEEVERQTKLYSQQNTSLKNLQDAQVQLALLRITAPLAGTITRLNARPGGAVDVNTVVAEVMDLDRLAVKIDLPAAAGAEIKNGQEVQVLTEPATSATLDYVSPAVDDASGTIAVWAALAPGSPLRPGQFVSVRIVTAVHTNCLAAPQDSVVTGENGQSAVSLVQGDQAAQTPVSTGFRENGWVEIAGSGLKPGDAVVTVGAYGLPDKTRLQVANAPAEPAAATNSTSASEK